MRGAAASGFRPVVTKRGPTRKDRRAALMRSAKGSRPAPKLPPRVPKKERPRPVIGSRAGFRAAWFLAASDLNYTDASAAMLARSMSSTRPIQSATEVGEDIRFSAIENADMRRAVAHVAASARRLLAAADEDDRRWLTWSANHLRDVIRGPSHIRTAAIIALSGYLDGWLAELARVGTRLDDAPIVVPTLGRQIFDSRYEFSSRVFKRKQ